MQIKSLLLLRSIHHRGGEAGGELVSRDASDVGVHGGRTRGKTRSNKQNRIRRAVRWHILYVCLSWQQQEASHLPAFSNGWWIDKPFYGTLIISFLTPYNIPRIPPPQSSTIRTYTDTSGISEELGSLLKMRMMRERMAMRMMKKRIWSMLSKGTVTSFSRAKELSKIS